MLQYIILLQIYLLLVLYSLQVAVLTLNLMYQLLSVPSSNKKNSFHLKWQVQGGHNNLNVQFQKNPYPPHGRSLEISRERVVLKATILEAKYEPKLEFPGGRGCNTKNLPCGRMDIFWNCKMWLAGLLGRIGIFLTRHDANN